MTVKELREYLEQFDEDATVLFGQDEELNNVYSTFQVEELDIETGFDPTEVIIFPIGQPED